MVRIINRKTAERALLKDLTGRVVDIAFAYTDDVILAAVDEIGNLLVHSIKEGDDKKIQYPWVLMFTFSDSREISSHIFIVTVVCHIL